jgi:hypothetical protein
MSKSLRLPALLSMLLAGIVIGPLPARAQFEPPWRPAKGVETPSGCEIPKLSATHRTFYIDPVNGSAGGDGSKSNPWNSLNDIVTKGYISNKQRGPDGASDNPAKGAANSPIHPGDVILLESGDYGNIKIQGYFGVGDKLSAFDNVDFITIEAAPDATPVLDGLLLLGGAKWVFRGLTIRNFRANLDGHSGGYLAAFQGPHHDIIFDGNTLLSTSDVSGWSQADWLGRASSGIFDYGGTYNGASCITITNNRLLNLSFGIFTQRSDKVLVKGNLINYFLHTAIMFGSNNNIIRNNVITNRIDAGDMATLHPQFMRGTSWGCTAADEHCDTLTNVTIDGNITIRQTDPNIPLAHESKSEGLTMGIVIFDGQWYDLRVTNNVVITTELHGLAYYGAHRAVIANNTVLGDRGGNSRVPWITVQNEKNHEISSDIIIRNNISNGLHYAAETTNISVDHNICLSTNGKCNLALAFNGRLDRFSLPGDYGDHNRIDLRDASDLFRKFTVVDGCVTALDLNLLPNTHAVGTGNPENAPATDITGAARTVPFDLGAYKYASSAPTATTKAQP